jgi:DnaK suppressor protein
VSLSAQSLKHFQERLLEQKRQLQQMLFSQGSKGHAQLRSVGQALQRIEDGSFGECTHCGNEIGGKRLEALPSTPYCIECQEKLEKGELGDASRAA